MEQLGVKFVLKKFWFEKVMCSQNISLLNTGFEKIKKVLNGRLLRNEWMKIVKRSLDLIIRK